MTGVRKLAKWFLPLAIISLLGAAVTPQAGRSAREKIEGIESESLRPGEAVTLTEDEINALIRYDHKVEIPEGVRDVQVEIFQDRGKVRAYVDWTKVQAARGEDPGYLLGWLLSGERLVKATCHFTSANGQGTVDVESVEIDDTEVSGRILDWLIANYVAPHVPEFEPGKPMPFAYNLKEVRLEPGRAVAVVF